MLEVTFRPISSETIKHNIPDYATLKSKTIIIEFKDSGIGFLGYHIVQVLYNILSKKWEVITDRVQWLTIPNEVDDSVIVKIKRYNPSSFLNRCNAMKTWFILVWQDEFAKIAPSRFSLNDPACDEAFGMLRKYLIPKIKEICVKGISPAEEMIKTVYPQIRRVQL